MFSIREILAVISFWLLTLWISLVWWRYLFIETAKEIAREAGEPEKRLAGLKLAVQQLFIAIVFVLIYKFSGRRVIDGPGLFRGVTLGLIFWAVLNAPAVLFKREEKEEKQNLAVLFWWLTTLVLGGAAAGLILG